MSSTVFSLFPLRRQPPDVSPQIICRDINKNQQKSPMYSHSSGGGRCRFSRHTTHQIFAAVTDTAKSTKSIVLPTILPCSDFGLAPSVQTCSPSPGYGFLVRDNLSVYTHRVCLTTLVHLLAPVQRPHRELRYLLRGNLQALPLLADAAIPAPACVRSAQPGAANNFCLRDSLLKLPRLVHA